MSILVRGLDKPVSCDLCHHYETFDCYLWEQMEDGEIHPDCPVTEVIQCRECKHYLRMMGYAYHGMCDLCGLKFVNEDEFCIIGEKKGSDK